MYTRGSAANFRVQKNASSKDLFSRHREIRDNKVNKNKVKRLITLPKMLIVHPV